MRAFVLAGLGLLLACSAEEAGPGAKAGRPCSREQDCAGGLSCRWRHPGGPTTLETVCAAEAPKAAPHGGLCSVSGCKTGTCYQGVCADVCVTSADCASGTVCAAVTGIQAGAFRPTGSCPDLAGVPGARLCLPEQGLLVSELGGVKPGESVVVDFPEGAASLALVGMFLDSRTIAFDRLVGPAGNDLFVATQDPAAMLENDVWFYPEPFAATLQIPTTPDRPPTPGPHCVTADGEFALYSVAKRDRDGDVESGRLNLDVHLVGLDTAGCGVGGALATTASTHPVLADAVKTAKEIFAGVQIELGDVAFHDHAEPPGMGPLSTAQPESFDPLHYQPPTSYFQHYSIDVFIVKSITDAAGYAGHMPGPPGIHGHPRSGVVLSAESACSGTLGIVLAHEVSHLLGLFHNFQPDPGFEDPIADTDSGQQNLMHIAPNAQSRELTPGQGFVLRRHANVSW